MDLPNTKAMNEYQFGAEWSVDKSTVKSVDESGFMQSPTYSIPTHPDIKYYLTLYPREPVEDVKQQPQVIIEINFETKKKIYVSGEISVPSASFEAAITEEVFDDEFQSYDISMCNRTKLFDPNIKYFDADQVLKIEFNGIVKLEEEAVEEKVPGPMSLSKALWESNNDKDITIVADKKEIKIHKWILCGNSPVFKAEMESGMKESQEKRIVITDFKFNTVKTAIEYCYERKIDDKVNEENAYELLHFADKYDIKGFKDMLQALLVPMITVANVVKLANMSITSLSVELLEACINFSMKYAGTKTAINDIKNLDNEIFNEIGRRSFNLS